MEGCWLEQADTCVQMFAAGFHRLRPAFRRWPGAKGTQGGISPGSLESHCNFHTHWLDSDFLVQAFVLPIWSKTLLSRCSGCAKQLTSQDLFV